MTDRPKSILVEEQFPEWLRSEESRLIDLVRVYYKYIERDARPSERVLDTFDTILPNARVDTANSEFIEYIISELAPDVPAATAVDRRLLAKRSNDIFDVMGTEDGLRLLFRAYYDEDSSIGRPGEFVLKPSDGHWLRRDQIAVEGTYAGQLEGMRVRGDTSEASADVEGVSFETRFDVDVTVMRVSAVVGNFVNGETLRLTRDGTLVGTLYGVVGPVSVVEVTDGGFRHEVGDEVDLRASGGRNATGVVRETDDGSAVSFRLVDGGSGYRFDAAAEAAGDYRGIIEVVIGEPGEDAEVLVKSVVDTEPLDITDEPIGGVANAPLNSAMFGNTSFATGHSPPSTRLAAASVANIIEESLNLIQETIGSIGEIDVLNNGRGFSFLPAVTVLDSYISSLRLDGDQGSNARIAISSIEGALKRVEVLTGGENYIQGESLDIVNTKRDITNDGEGIATVRAFTIDPGRYRNRRGWISDENKLHDGDFYQDAAYLVRGSLDERRFRNDVERAFHPAGTKMFTETVITNVADGASPIGSVVETSTSMTP